MKNSKVAIILDSPFPPDPRVENEALSLSEAGYDIHLLCVDYSGKLPEREDYKGIKIYRLRLKKIVYKLSALAYSLKLYHIILKKHIKAFLQKLRPDFIHIHDMQSARAVFCLKPVFKAVYLLDLHENRPEIMKFYPHLNKFPGNLIISPRKWKQNEKRLIEKADRLIVVTPEAKDYYRKNYGTDKDKIALVPNTVRKEFYTSFQLDETILNKFKKNFVLLYVGDTGYRRGISTVMEALRLLVKDIPEIQLIIVGKSSYDARLKELADSLKIAKHISFEGWQKPAFFQSYISAADICLSPIHRNIHHDTTYANKIFQYMALKKPVIASNCKAQASVLKSAEAGLIFRDRDAEDLSRKILYLYKNPEEAKKMGENGAIFIKNKFSWEHQSKELINLYRFYSKKNS